MTLSDLKGLTFDDVALNRTLIFMMEAIPCAAVITEGEFLDDLSGGHEFHLDDLIGHIQEVEYLVFGDPAYVLALTLPHLQVRVHASGPMRLVML